MNVATHLNSHTPLGDGRIGTQQNCRLVGDRWADPTQTPGALRVGTGNGPKNVDIITNYLDFTSR